MTLNFRTSTAHHDRFFILCLRRCYAGFLLSRAPNRVSNEHLVFGPYYLRTHYLLDTQGGGGY